MSNALKNKKGILINAVIIFLQLIPPPLFFGACTVWEKCTRYTTLISFLGEYKVCAIISTLLDQRG